MTALDETLDKITVTIKQEIHVKAPLDITFAALLEPLTTQLDLALAPVLGQGLGAWRGAIIAAVRRSNAAGRTIRATLGLPAFSPPE